MSQLSHIGGIWLCSRATLDDVTIALCAYLATGAIANDRYWKRRARLNQVALFISIGIIVTMFLEWFATKVFVHWQYTSEMLVLPALGTAMAQLLQWFVIPLVTVFSLRRLWLVQN